MKWLSQPTSAGAMPKRGSRVERTARKNGSVVLYMGPSLFRSADSLRGDQDNGARGHSHDVSHRELEA